MSRLTASKGRQVATGLPGRAGASAGVLAPYLVLDLGRGVDPHQARCRRCRWRSRWRATAAQVRAEHDRHQVATHGRHASRRRRACEVALGWLVGGGRSEAGAARLGPAPRAGWGSPPPPGRHRPELSGVTVLVLVTALAALAAPHAQALRGKLVDAGGLPAIRLPKLPAAPPATRTPPGLSFTNRAGCRPASDWTSPRLDRRVRALLVAVAAHHRIRVSCLRSGHSWYVKGTRRASNHSVWRGVDIDQVDGRPVSRANAAARQLALWIGRGGAGVWPSEVGSPWAFRGRPWFSDAAHQGHLHVGFAGPTRTGGR